VGRFPGDGAQRTSTTAGEGGRAQGAVRSFERKRSSCSTSTLDEVEATLDNRSVKDPITGEERKPDERFLRSVEEKIRISESGKLSFRQEVVRKAMGAYKRSEKFTLDSHAPLHDAVEQYLFEQRRDVLRLVSSTTRPTTKRRRDLGGREAAGRRVRLRRAQRPRGAQLRDQAFSPRNSLDQDRRRNPLVRAVLARRAPIGCDTTRKCAKAVKQTLPELLAGADLMSQPGHRTVLVPVKILEHARLRPARARGAAGGGQGCGEPAKCCSRGREEGERAGAERAGTQDGEIRFWSS